MFCQLLEEARSSSGTWSLKTYASIRTSVERFDLESIVQFADSIVEALLTETKPTTRYKLAQMCTILRSLRTPLEGVFQKHQQRIEAHYKEIEEADLGHSTVKLLKSLFQELAKRRGSSGLTAPSIHMRETKVNPQLFARTPEPGMDPNELAYLRNQGSPNATSQPNLF